MRHAFLAALAALFLAACGEGTSGEPGCEPGEVVACECESGATGTAACGHDRAPGACACAGELEFAPARLDLGDVPLGTLREVTLLLWTQGARAIAVTDVVVEGHPGFALSSAAEEVPPGGAGAPVVVSFESDAPAEASGTLTVRTNAGDLSVPLSARAVGAAVSCTPTELSWVDVPLGVRRDKTVTCTNVGLYEGGELGLIELTEAWLDHPEFTVSAGAGSSGPGESFQFTFTYLPTDEEADAVTARLRFALMELSGNGALAGGQLEVEFALIGSTKNVPCNLVAYAGSIVEVPSREVPLQANFLNQRPDAGCRLARVEVAPGCSEDFSFDLPEPGRVIDPSGQLIVPVTFESEDVGLHRCEFRVVDLFDNVFVATLEVDVSYSGCLEVKGERLPDVSPSCGASDGAVVVTNSCTMELPIDNIALAGGASPAFSIGPFEPTSIAGSSTLTIPVFFNPDAEGSHEATVEVSSPLEPFPWAAWVGGESGPDDIYKRHMLQNPFVPDVLVVIDNGVTMGPEAALALRELGPAPELLRGYDYHLAVTTTGRAHEAAGGCPGGVGGGEDGRLFPVDGSRPRIVTRATPNARATWEQNLQVGTCHTAPSRALEAAALAVSPGLADVADDPRHPEENDGNEGFLRAGARLVVIIVSDRDDASPGTPDSYFDALVAAKNGDRMLLDVVVIAGPPPTGCAGPGGTSAAPGDRLHQFAEGAFGRQIPVCDPVWGVLQLFDQELSSCFEVGGVPADRNEDGELNEADLRVRVGLEEVPAFDPLDGSSNWSWRPDLQKVCFQSGRLPPPSALVEIERLYCPAAE